MSLLKKVIRKAKQTIFSSPATQNRHPTEGTIKIGNDSYKTKIVPGDTYGEALLNSGRFDEGMDFFHLTNYLLPQNATVLDIGAYIGMTVYCLNSTRKVKQVYAFEPTSPTVEICKENLEANNITMAVVNKLAVDSKDGEVKMNRIDGFMAGNMIITEDVVVTKNVETVKTTSIDNFVKKNTIKKVDYIKIDVEGHEIYAFEGMKKTLKTFQPYVYMEFNSAVLTLNRNLTPKDAFYAIKKYFNYIFWHKKDNTLELLDTSEKIRDFFNYNLFNGFVDNLVGCHTEAQVRKIKKYSKNV